MRNWVADGRWPFGSDPPWDVPAVKAWMAETLRTRPADSTLADLHARDRRRQTVDDESSEEDEIEAIPHIRARLEARLLREQRLKRRVERLKIEGRLHDVEACRANRLGQLAQLRDALMDLPRRLAPSLAGLGRSDVERLLTEAMAEQLRQFAEGYIGDTREQPAEARAAASAPSPSPVEPPSPSAAPAPVAATPPAGRQTKEAPGS